MLSAARRPGVLAECLRSLFPPAAEWGDDTDLDAALFVLADTLILYRRSLGRK